MSLSRKWRLLRVLFALCLVHRLSPAQSIATFEQLSSAKAWQLLEFRIKNVPAVANPFDPSVIRLDAQFSLPSGGKAQVPGFWYQPYQRMLSNGSESLSTAGPPEWRIRYLPPEPGAYSVALTIQTNGQAVGATVVTNFVVATNTASKKQGYVRVASGQQYFETGDGQALQLLGENVAWPGSAGTSDYDTWFTAMQQAGENYARIWMCPWWLGIETEANSLTRYRLDRAWQLDYVLQTAEAHGIYLLLCLDYHGMFEVTPDYFGGNNYWPTNPYNVANGGPCVNQNGFFTNTTAKVIYQKRLRYLVARYGYSSQILAWQFLNEIDNEYAYLNPSDVAAWHGAMGAWMHANDPFHHLVTTSLTGGSDRPEIWSLQQLDFSAYHSYGEASPAGRLADVTQSFLQRYHKPVLIDEFGTDWRGWNRANDLYLRGFRQGLYGGALGGSAGTAMSWWWETIHAENDYPVYSALHTILNRTGWGTGQWTNIGFQTSGPPPPTVGELIPSGKPFTTDLLLNGTWGGKPSGQLAIANSSAADFSSINFNSFVHGFYHSDLKVPFRLSAWFTNNARLVLHLNSVSDQAIMVIKADGSELYRTNLPNLDGGFAVNNEYNMDIPVNLPAGKRLIEITNAGGDWFYLDSVRLEQVLPSYYSTNWQPSPEAIGLQGLHESLIYVVAPGVSFPAGATNAALPLQQTQSVTLTSRSAGKYFADWYAPGNGSLVGSTQSDTVSDGTMTVVLPDFSEDLVGVLYPAPRLTLLSVSNNQMHLQLDSETGGRYKLGQSTDLVNWSNLETITNTPGTTDFWVPLMVGDKWIFLRAQKVLP